MALDENIVRKIAALNEQSLPPHLLGHFIHARVTNVDSRTENTLVPKGSGMIIGGATPTSEGGQRTIQVIDFEYFGQPSPTLQRIKVESPLPVGFGNAIFLIPKICEAGSVPIMNQYETFSEEDKQEFETLTRNMFLRDLCGGGPGWKGREVVGYTLEDMGECEFAAAVYSSVSGFFTTQMHQDVYGKFQNETYERIRNTHADKLHQRFREL